MKICCLCTSFLPAIGGAEFAIHYLGNALVDLGHEVLVLAPAYDRENGIASANYTIRRYQFPPRGHFLEQWLWIQLYLARARFAFEIVHAHLTYPAGYCALKFGRYRSIPVVVTSQGADIQLEPKMNYGIRLDPKIDSKVRSVIRNANALTTISRSMMEEILDLGAEPAKTYLIPNGVALSEFQQTEEDGNCLPSRYILAMGRLVYKKGFDVLLRAYAIVADHRPDVNMVIAGLGPEMPRLQEMCSELGVADKVSFVGFQHGQHKIHMLRSCEVFVSLSRKEPLGIVNIEAMAAGKPIVATRVDGIPDLVMDGYNGFLVPPESPEDAAHAVMALLENCQLRKDMGTRSAQSAKAYDWHVLAQQYVQVYHTVTLDA